MMKKMLLLLPFLMLLFPLLAQGQIVVTIENYDYYGNQPAGYYWVMMGPVGYVDCQATSTQHIYTAAELIANGAPVGGGKIPRISLYQYLYTYSIATTSHSIYMAHTSSDNLQSNPTVFDEILVYHRDNWTIPNPAYSWYAYDFDTHFDWNGTDNILVSFCRNTPGTPPGSYPNYLHALQTRYGYSGYPLTYQPSQYKTRYWYNYDQTPYGSGNPTPPDWCQTKTAPGSNWGPYSTYQRADMRFEICNQDPLVYDMTVPTIHYLPGTLPVTWSVGRLSGSFTAKVTLNLYRPDGGFVKSETFNVPINANTMNGVYQYSMMGVPPGYYRLEAVFNGLDECGNMVDHFVNRAVMILAPGSVPCEVWPGDVNNNGIVNYGDRRDLNQYIQDANLSPIWLVGPARYRVDLDVNPLAYYNWEPQPAVPWQTSEGCYMDSDGNGMINNFDYIAIKLNWMKTHGLSTKSDANTFSITAFSMDQNYPNPFNPSTSISYTVPERSNVRLVVVDLLGREVATLVNDEIETGRHIAEFDASQLSSGNYMARIQITGLESGATYTRTIKMTLGK